MNLHRLNLLIGLDPRARRRGSYNIPRAIHAYIIDYLKYSQHLRAKMQEVQTVFM
jgi:hypothetical protein